MRATAALLAAALAALPVASHAQQASLQGTMGGKALLIVDGAPPRLAGPGDVISGVRVLAVAGDQATVDVKGRRFVLRVGESPASVGSSRASGEGSRIVIPVGSGGHFTTAGAVNGRAVNFVVDTGATMVSMGLPDAQRLGVDYKSGRAGLMNTANGTATAWLVKLASVRVGDVELHEVDATVVQSSMPYVLLGNSFLSRFSMKRDSDTLVLERRY